MAHKKLHLYLNFFQQEQHSGLTLNRVYLEYYDCDDHGNTVGPSKQLTHYINEGMDVLGPPSDTHVYDIWYLHPVENEQGQHMMVNGKSVVDISDKRTHTH